MRIGPCPYLFPISEVGLCKAGIRPDAGRLEPLVWPALVVPVMPAGDGVSRFHCRWAVAAKGLVMLTGLRMLRGFPLMNFPGALTDA